MGQMSFIFADDLTAWRGARVIWANRLADIVGSRSGRLLLSWYHPEDGMQMTWADPSEVRPITQRH